jgi:nucleotide-binding universal stress UspA family protein
MHASDFSPASMAALRVAIKMARVRRSPLIVLHVRVPTLPVMGGARLRGGPYVTPRTWAALEEESRRAARHHLRRLLTIVSKGGVRATSLLVDGVPADMIVRAARAQHALLLVVGTHGRTGPRRLLLGSVATKVVALARCPVLIVPGRRALGPLDRKNR